MTLFLNHIFIFRDKIFYIIIQLIVRAKALAESLDLSVVQQGHDALAAHHALQLLEELVPLVLVAEEIQVREKDRALLRLS